MENRNSNNSGVANWTKVHPFFWKQMLIGALSFIVPGRKSSNSNCIKDFFVTHYSNKKDPLVFDGNSDRYLEQLIPAINDSKSLGNIIDLGCGKAELLAILKKNNFVFDSYIGFDFACDNRVISDNEKTYHLDFRSKECLKVTKTKNTIFAINTFCYIDNLEDIYLLKNLNKNRLIVLEPWPGLFWDRHFNGIWPSYRKPQVLEKNLAKIGWHRDSHFNYYLYNFFGKYFMPMSYVSIFKKGKS